MYGIFTYIYHKNQPFMQVNILVPWILWVRDPSLLPINWTFWPRYRDLPCDRPCHICSLCHDLHVYRLGFWRRFSGFGRDCWVNVVRERLKGTIMCLDCVIHWYVFICTENEYRYTRTNGIHVYIVYCFVLMYIQSIYAQFDQPKGSERNGKMERNGKEWHYGT